MTTDDFDARWRAAANADPGHATYPEAVPGYRAQRHAAPRTAPAEGSGKAEPYTGDPWTAEPGDDAIGIDGGGRMVVVFRKPDGSFRADVPRADAPVTVAEIQELAAAIERDPASDLNPDAVRDLAAPAKLATDDAVQALADAITRAERKHERRWWDPRRWWTR